MQDDKIVTDKTMARYHQIRGDAVAGVYEVIRRQKEMNGHLQASGNWFYDRLMRDLEKILDSEDQLQLEYLRKATQSIKEDITKLDELLK